MIITIVITRRRKMMIIRQKRANAQTIHISPYLIFFTIISIQFNNSVSSPGRNSFVASEMITK